MTLDRELVGRSYPPSAVYEVGRAKIAEFAAAVGAADPVHTDPEAARAAGHADVIAPPTFAIVVSLEAADGGAATTPTSGLDYSRVVHGEQRFTHHRPIRAGDRLVATTTIDAARTVAGNDMLTARVDLATEDGEPVCTSTSMLVARGTAMSAASDVAVGTELPEQTFRVTRADLVRYAGASGDFNPIHWNERVATSVGPARTSSRTACSPWRWPPGRSPSGPATPARWSSTRCASAGRSSCRTTTRAPSSPCRARSPRSWTTAGRGSTSP